MKNAFVIAVAVVLAVGATPALAGDGNVSHDTLAALGLADIRPMSDAEGLEVRGKTSTFGLVMGTSVVFGQLLSPDTKNFVVGSDLNMVTANAESTNALGKTIVTKDHGSEVVLALEVVAPPSNIFAGALAGFAGGFGIVTAKP